MRFMKEREFNSDRYFELRHDLVSVSEYHEDYDCSNAIAYGKTKSIRVSGPKKLEIIASAQRNNKEAEDYQVRIEYLNEGEYSGLENNTRG